MNVLYLRDMYYGSRLKPNHAYMGCGYYKTILRVYLIEGHKDKNNAHKQQKTFSMLLPTLLDLIYYKPWGWCIYENIKTMLLKHLKSPCPDLQVKFKKQLFKSCLIWN